MTQCVKHLHTHLLKKHLHTHLLKKHLLTHLLKHLPPAYSLNTGPRILH
jgi:hypothetical protein